MGVIAQIGTGSAIKIACLQDVINKARQPDFAEIDQQFAAVLERLQKAHARISVVGQVKAGKSSLINALTGMNGFLPTEVNPWTAVITDLHFGLPGKQERGGEFQLFSEEEWNRVLEGDKETRKMAQELLPGFNEDVLKQQVEEMREKAKKRLGSLYKHLLGRKHQFNLITPEILERYVSAGYTDCSDPNSTAGKFSGITKSAAVFMPAGPFAIPITVSDTPGINDPFLVRDEITTSSFQRADIFIVALSVHQALNTADIALLKMLSVHTGKKTIIFVNRIDEVENPAETVPEVLKNLNERLQTELDNPNYTLVAGSAHWGSLAADGSDDDVAQVAGDARLKSYCDGISVSKKDTDREKLFAASGLKALGETLTRIIAEGPTNSILSETVSEIATAISLLKSLLQETLISSDGELDGSATVEDAIEQENKRISDAVERHEKRSVRLANVLATARDDLFDNGDVVFKSVETTINAATSAFADAQVANLRNNVSGTDATGSWQLETGDIHKRVESQVIESYASGRDGLDGLLLKHAEIIQEIVGQIGGAVEIDTLHDNLPHDQIMPNFKPKSTMVQVELDRNRGWKFWQRATLSEDEAIERILKVFRAEIYPAAEALRRTAREAIAERTDAGLERLTSIINTAKSLIRKEIKTLRSEQDLLESGEKDSVVERINHDRQMRARERKMRIDDLDEALTIIHEQFQNYSNTEKASDLCGADQKHSAVV